ncbi:riboflavin biosynthesis protein RibF [Pediococcus stilesii]|uniref:Riboflavin biosynthesis protein n=1 Tax=Pediococcus stilesii TaxID=331679 RepID=A0A0R2L8P3_9LACO|nr:riboflavin biosynthesis protein RibF [Pediococcus stilesii]KRN95197.1 riboflavin biosynthesis protein RibF [Pediococcus stilesii]
MEIIKIHHPYQKEIIPEGPVVLALGFFDGVHRGHQAVIQKASEIAHEKHLKVAAMTFDHHSSVVFPKPHHKFSSLNYLTSVDRKAELMEELGVDLLYVVNFTSSFGSLSPKDFVEQYMVGLHAEAVVAGFDYTFGPIETANMDTLPGLAADRFEVVRVPKIIFNERKIGSTKIREMISNGNIDDANRYLGYPFQTKGLVVHGEARGRELGFPTANIVSNENQITPGIGIYVVEMQISGRWYKGMASVGRNVVFGDGRPVTTEINILDFKQAIYGETVRVRWYHRLRGEVKFNSVEELIEQLHRDEADTRTFFEKI